jgi:head-tail adaptor
MLTESELEGMRSTLAESLPESAVIQTASVVSDGGGGGTTTWTASGTVDCRMAPIAAAGEDETVSGGRIHPDTEYMFTLPAETTLTTDSRITYSGKVFTVTSLRAPRTWEIGRRVEVKEVR